MTTPPADKPVSESGSFGSMLQEARTAQQISIDDAASELFILKRHLQALEAEDFAALPQHVYARGFAINYAKFLQLDTDQVAHRFDAVYPDALKPSAASAMTLPMAPVGSLSRSSGRRLRINPFLIVALIALVALAVFLFNMVSQASKDNQADTSPPEVVSASEQAQGAALSNQGSSIGAAGSALNLDTAEATEDAALDININDAVTLTVKDAAGDTLLAGNQNRGDYRLKGTPPFDITIADIDKVTLQLNQEAVSLAQYANEDKQATFSLAP